MATPAMPITGECVITLNDGVARVFRETFRAAILREQLLLKNPHPIGAAEALAMVVWGGCQQDALKRGEELSFDAVVELMPARGSAAHLALAERIVEAEKAAGVVMGEPVAVVAAKDGGESGAGTSS